MSENHVHVFDENLTPEQLLEYGIIDQEEFLTKMHTIKVNSVTEAANTLAKSITPVDAISGCDATGGTVTSLTEAVMGMTAGLVKIADAIESLADAVSELKSK